MRLRFPVSDVRPAWIDGSAGAWPAHSSLPAPYSSHPPFCLYLLSSYSSAPCCPPLHYAFYLRLTLPGLSHSKGCEAQRLHLSSVPSTSQININTVAHTSQGLSCINEQTKSLSLSFTWRWTLVADTRESAGLKYNKQHL